MTMKILQLQLDQAKTNQVDLQLRIRILASNSHLRTEPPRADCREGLDCSVKSAKLDLHFRKREARVGTTPAAPNISVRRIADPRHSVLPEHSIFIMPSFFTLGNTSTHEPALSEISQSKLAGKRPSPVEIACRCPRHPLLHRLPAKALPALRGSAAPPS